MIIVSVFLTDVILTEQKQKYQFMKADKTTVSTVKEVDDMEFRLTSESMELLIESIVDAVEFTDDRDMQFKLVKTILEDNGIVEIKE